MNINVVNTQSAFYSKFLEFVTQKSLLFHSPEWINLYPKEQLVQCAIFNKNNEIIGCFMYYHFKKYTFNFIITPPFTPHIELFYLNPAESIVGKHSFTKEILKVIADYFNGLTYDYINLNLSESHIDSQPFVWNSFTSRNRYTYLINLNLSQEEIWNNFSSEKRKSINKAEKDDIKILPSTDLTKVYDLILSSLSRNDVAKNAGIIKNIILGNALTGNIISYTAYHHNKAIAASFCIVNQSKAIYLFGGFDSENKHHGAGVSCMWHSILKAKERKLSHFDFEGSMNESIERYFREFGGNLQSYVCVEKIKPLLQFIFNLTRKKLI